MYIPDMDAPPPDGIPDDIPDDIPAGTIALPCVAAPTPSSAVCALPDDTAPPPPAVLFRGDAARRLACFCLLQFIKFVVQHTAAVRAQHARTELQQRITLSRRLDT